MVVNLECQGIPNDTVVLKTFRSQDIYLSETEIDAIEVTYDVIEKNGVVSTRFFVTNKRGINSSMRQVTTSNGYHYVVPPTPTTPLIA
jgi:hypothetical protein